jgi:peroxiredoxin
LTAAVVVAAGFVGVYVGSASRSVVDESPQPALTDIFPNLKLVPGASFPDLPLVADDNTEISSHQVIGPEGAIVVFVDLGCPPCEELTKKFQSLIEAGDLRADQVVGIGPTTPVDYLSGFYTTYGLTFPIYSDTAARFMHEFGVQGYPIMLVVGPDHRIRHALGDSRTVIDADVVADWLKL